MHTVYNRSPMITHQSKGDSPFLLYRSGSGDVRIHVLLRSETVWLTQQQMAELFHIDRSGIIKHIQNIYESAELEPKTTCAKIAHVAKDGKKRKMDFYNLDVIISVGYRVNSHQATLFRQWATQRLKEYIIKGFVMDDERMKEGTTHFGKDYFDELLERVRAIRASERRVYQKITDIFSECSIDYDPRSDITRTFYATVQNKFHYAITGQTAAEIITENANATKTNMGLKTWKRSPKGRILKSDALVAKNYLTEEKIKKLERLVTMYFDYIEGLVEKRTTFTMQQLAESINRFMEFNEYQVLEHTGSVSHEQMERKVEQEYEQFRRMQDRRLESDFDKEVKKLTDHGSLPNPRQSSTYDY